MTPRLALVVAACLSLGVAQPADDDQALARALARVSGRAVRAHVEFLADDLLEGRATATRGHEIAARYVAAQLALQGLKPAGDGSSFLQQVPLLESRLTSGSVAIEGPSGRTALELRRDFLMAADASRTETSVEAPVVFAGFGVTAPRQGQDDYAGLDVKGKIVAVLANAPARLPSEERAYHASRTRKAELAAEHGAVGLVTLRTPAEETRTPWERAVGFAEAPTTRWTNRDGAPEGALEGLRGNALLSLDASRRLFAAAPVAFEAAVAAAEQPKFRGFALGVRAALASRGEQTRVTSPNVVGLLEGSDPALRSTCLVYSAHLDHVGLGPQSSGDRIHNGAYDNALGSAVVLEVARVLAGLEKRAAALGAVPVRHRGGARAARLGVLRRESHGAPGALVANVNVDMPLVLFPMAEVVAFGAENSTLDAPARAAAAAVGLALAPDPMPEQTIFVRSDQFSFVRKGIPAVYFSPGTRSSDPAQDGPRLFREFLEKHYHRPSDDLSLPMDEAAIALYTRANVALGLRIAHDPAAPRWKAGNFFGETFAR